MKPKVQRWDERAWFLLNNPAVYFFIVAAALAALFGINMAWSSLSNADEKTQHVEIKLKDDFMAQLGTGAAPVLQGAFRGDGSTSFIADACISGDCPYDGTAIDPSINMFLYPNIKK